MGLQKHFDIDIAYYRTDDLLTLRGSAPLRKADYHNNPREWGRMASASRAGKHGGIVIAHMMLTEHDWTDNSVVALEPTAAFVDADVRVDFINSVVLRTYGKESDAKMEIMEVYGKNLGTRILKRKDDSYLTFKAKPTTITVKIDTKEDNDMLSARAQQERMNPLDLKLVPTIDEDKRLEIKLPRGAPAIAHELVVHDIKAAIDAALNQTAKIKRTVVPAMCIIVSSMTKAAHELLAQALLLNVDEIGNGKTIADSYRPVYAESANWVAVISEAEITPQIKTWLARRDVDDQMLLSKKAEVREDVIWPLMTAEEKELANILQAIYDRQCAHITHYNANDKLKPWMQRSILRAQLEREAFCEDNAQLIQRAHARFHAEFFTPTKAQLAGLDPSKIDSKVVGHDLAKRWHDARADLAAALRQIAIKTLVVRVFANRVIRMLIHGAHDLQMYELEALTSEEKKEIAKVADSEDKTVAAYQIDAQIPAVINPIRSGPQPSPASKTLADVQINVPETPAKVVTFSLPALKVSELASETLAGLMFEDEDEGELRGAGPPLTPLLDLPEEERDESPTTPIEEPEEMAQAIVPPASTTDVGGEGGTAPPAAPAPAAPAPAPLTMPPPALEMTDAMTMSLFY